LIALTPTLELFADITEAQQPVVSSREVVEWTEEQIRRVVRVARVEEFGLSTVTMP
jgi:hypothetical protein